MRLKHHIRVNAMAKPTPPLNMVTKAARVEKRITISKCYWTVAFYSMTSKSPSITRSNRPVLHSRTTSRTSGDGLSR